MSDYESHVGVLRPVDLNGQSIEDYYKQIVGDAEVEVYETYKEAAMDITEKTYVEFQGKLYVADDERGRGVELEHMESRPDGSYSYAAVFYNGGTDLQEVLYDLIASTPPANSTDGVAQEDSSVASSLPPAEAVSEGSRWSPKSRFIAAQIRIQCDKKLGDETPEWILKIAEEGEGKFG